MSLITAMDINASGLTAQRRRVELSTANLANSQTTRTDEGGPYHADEVLHGRFDRCVPPAVVEELVSRLQQHIGNDWARRADDKFGG